MNPKKATTITLFIFWAITTAVLTAGLVVWENKKSQGNSFNGQANVQPNEQASTSRGTSAKANTGSQASNKPSSVVLSLGEVAKHNKRTDCWMIISNKVYNFTAVLSSHPGGAGTMLPYCGKDGTQGFATKDLSQPRSHSGSANNSLTDYFIGNLNQTIQSNNQVAPVLGSRGELEDD